MTKTYTFQLDERQSNFFLAAIRRKQDLILMLMEAIKLMRLKENIDKQYVVSTLVLHVSKMSRIFFFSEDKYYSFVCPFFVRETEMGLEFHSQFIGEIDSIAISNVISIFRKENSILDGNCISTLADEVMDCDYLRPQFWNFLKELLLIESGYLRFDHDKVRSNGDLHPLNHLDIFYSSKATFKVGLDHKIQVNAFLDMLDTQSSCAYLSNGKNKL